MPIALCSTFTLSYFWLHCYWGAFTTNSFGKYANCLYGSQWHSLTISLQKYWTIILPNMQRPLFYNGFGVVPLDLKTFANVSTYYLVSKIHSDRFFRNSFLLFVTISKYFLFLIQVVSASWSYYMAFSTLNQKS